MGVAGRADDGGVAGEGVTGGQGRIGEERRVKVEGAGTAQHQGQDEDSHRGTVRVGRAAQMKALARRRWIY
ncbi:hypothetical protein GCM10017781_46370 [Deinococcus metalli]|uniref:Uncharacterized protein n=1 Tax=Deinococcus metalli TaxID=1141878 RepID=A0ABQ3JXH3_9DEIO|nr:hypothetical protein GCM10017781_46370 [Deinococcus metalli]